MNLDKAIETLTAELGHIRHHLLAKHKDPEYYDELENLAEAMDMGIMALCENKKHANTMSDLTIIETTLDRQLAPLKELVEELRLFRKGNKS